MPGFLKKIVEFFKNMQKGQRIRIIVLASIVIVVVVVASVLFNQKSYAVLYSGMDSKDAGEVLSVLKDMDVDAVAKGSDTIMVASDQVDKVRMELAAQGYPNSGLNYDIFKNAAGLGTTDMEKQFYLQAQLAVNIAQTIKKMDKVDDAVVNIALADESAFALSDDNKPATAAVLLTLKNGKKLDNSEVRAIAELVSKSISGLSVDDVRIVDSKSNLYKIQDEDELETADTQLDLKLNVQQKLQEQVINLLKPVFGDGKVLAEVSVTLNFDKQTTESTVFTPPVEGNESGIAVSMKELAESVKNGTSTGGVAGIDSNGSASQYLSTSSDPNAVYNKVSKETNLEVNETRTQIENAKGQIKNLSVAIVLDSSDSIDDYRENVKQLVANAIGVKPDNITVDMLPFKQTETASGDSDAFAAQKQIMNDMQSAQTVRMVILAIAALLVMLILLAIIKTLRKRPVAMAGGMSFDGESINVLADEEVIPEPVARDVNFEVKDTNLGLLENYIDKSPEAVAQLLRNWLSEEYGR
jgi:flagellar M-ring protein FliF